MKPVDIAPTVEQHIRKLIGWLEKRRDDENWWATTEGKEIEIRRSEVEQIIEGLNQWAEALAILASVQVEKVEG